ncbi:group II truncated hemoglobin [Aggregicoccus sp. 17bor-14]|uniref:group II truncated hemoglobin n=1 Tax=Myxococcaceae TaxID=31 RepID=UPI00129CAA78|nr:MULTISPECIES: group II truncated hemoglobin [Myxococcaceae]MBF5046266.1 group II truncated hemoglobin [Simulacricoccus sp. 17bor-14]MRI91988.1 group II truncated hemoglobin [Aggregicoccus sp. 17bor-14]
MTTTNDDWLPSLEDSPFTRLGGEPGVRALAERFYDEMDAHEPALARLHRLDEAGRVSRESRERFGLFLVGWLGGPQHYTERHGHPRLRMRHFQTPVDSAMRDAWLRSMGRALDAFEVKGGLRRFLDERFAQVANFLRNVPEEEAQPAAAGPAPELAQLGGVAKKERPS